MKRTAVRASASKSPGNPARSDGKASPLETSTESSTPTVADAPGSADTVDAPAKPTATNRWTFFTNHAHVLIALHANPNLVLREVAVRVGITERAVQRIVQDLEEEGFIRRERVGRKNRYDVLTNEQLRHPVEAHRTIGDLLNLIHG